MRRPSFPPLRPRKGAGTIMGIMLVLLTATILGALAIGSSLVVRRSETRQEADLAALSAASSRLGLLPGRSPCEQAAFVLTLEAGPADSGASGNDARIVTCALQGQDVVVSVQADAGPFSSLTRMSSRAGPENCSKQ